MGSFLMIGILVAFLAGLGAVFFGLSGLALAVSAMFVLLMSGLILYETGNIIVRESISSAVAEIVEYCGVGRGTQTPVFLLVKPAG